MNIPDESRDLGLDFEETRSRQRYVVEVPGDVSVYSTPGRHKVWLARQYEVVTLRPLHVYSISTEIYEQMEMGSREDRTYPLLQFHILLLSDFSLLFPPLPQGCLTHRPFQCSRFCTLAFTLNPAIHLHGIWGSLGRSVGGGGGETPQGSLVDGRFDGWQGRHVFNNRKGGYVFNYRVNG